MQTVLSARRSLLLAGFLALAVCACHRVVSGGSKQAPGGDAHADSEAGALGEPRRPGPTETDLVLVPAGTFMMGSIYGEQDETPVHRVSVDSFYMSRTEITQEEYERLMEKNPSHFKGKTLPVEDVTWFDAIRYCNRRSIKEGKTPSYNESNGACNPSANGYRLPTEAEWEYACRAGNTDEYYGPADAIGWYDGNSGGKTHPVGSKRANAFGLYDMTGNVSEYCNDWYLGDYEQTTPAALAARVKRAGVWYRKETHEQNANELVLFVIRGGNWRLPPSWMRSAKRDTTHPKGTNDLMGFRVVLPVNDGRNAK